MALTNATPRPPDFNAIKAVVGHSGSLVLAMLAIANYCNSRPTAKTFKRALKEVGYSSPHRVLEDLELLQPFFPAAISDLKTFKTKLERTLGNE